MPGGVQLIVAGVMRSRGVVVMRMVVMCVVRRVVIVVRAVALGLVGRRELRGRAMMVKVKEPLDEEHQQKAAERPAHRLVDRAELVVAVRQ